MHAKNPIDRAADAVDGAGKLAALIGVSAQAISNWKERGVPLDRCVDVERLTGVRRWELRPEDWHRIWPELIGADGAPDVPAESEPVKAA